MDWNDLRYFLAVANAGTLVSAARALGVEHTTVSRRLSALETALGARLFTRGKDGYSLTAAGQDILASVTRIEELVSSIERRASGEDARVAGTVRLTIAEATNAYLVRRLAALRERHPELVVELLSGNRAYDLRRGEADIALRFGDVDDPELVVRKLCVSAWSLYASASYIEKRGALASIEDVGGHDFIGFDGSLSQIVGASWLSARRASIVLRGNSISAIADAAAAGLGIAPLPCFVADEQPALRRVTRETIGARELLLVVHPDLVRASRVRAVIDFLVEIFERDAATWSGVTRDEVPSRSQDQLLRPYAGFAGGAGGANDAGCCGAGATPYGAAGGGGTDA